MDDAGRMRARLLAAVASGAVLTNAGCDGPRSAVAVQPPSAPVAAHPPPAAQAPEAGAASPVDATTDVAADVTSAAADDVADAPTADAAAPARAAEGPSPRPRCGGRLEQHCFTREGMVAATAEHGLRAPGAPTPPRPTPRAAANGCFESRFLTDGCCNPAKGAPWRQGGRCCYWFCVGGCCGRPFEVDGHARTAPVVPSQDWAGPADTNDAVDALDAATRRALAASWRADAAMEHASVASFARFTLQLMALGAPPELLVEAQRAALDEVEHARRCFAVASCFEGEALGPGTLDVASASVEASLEGAVRAAVREGCVGETVAALVARARANTASDPAVRSTLAALADDEGRHAELAWRFVAWALSVDPSLRGAAEAAFAGAGVEGMAEPLAPPEGVDGRAWRAFGGLAREEAAGVVRRAWDDVVRPCAAALLGYSDLRYSTRSPRCLSVSPSENVAS